MSFEFDPNAVPSDPSGNEPSEPKRSSSVLPWLIAILLLVAVGAGGWWYLHRPLPGPAPTASAPTPGPAIADDVDSAPPVNPAQADALVRDWIARLLDQPDARWTSGGDLSRRIAGTIAAFANGEDPRSFLLALAPTGAFKVETRDGKTVIAPASFARFDWATRQLATLHADRVAEAWKAIRPLVASAWKEIAPRGSQLDDALGRALAHVLAVPVPDGPVPVVAHGAIYQYADPALEALSPAQKILLRMGPANEKIVQDQARRISDALGLSPAH